MKTKNVIRQFRSFLILHMLALCWVGSPASAQTPANPPTWMPMTMLNVTFNTNTHRLDVVDEAVKLGTNVYPVLIIATNGTYDSSQPWGVLNGTAYSRRLGWDDANRKSADVSLRILNQITNAYGPDAGIWIECVSHSPELNAYLAIGKYGVNANNSATNADGTVIIDPALNAYAGIFGTAGSSTKWRWDGQMDHNVYAVRLGDIAVTNQLFTATYRVYVGDALGNEILSQDGSSASTTEVWTWQGPATLVPPPLTIQSKMVVQWHGSSTNYVVESTDSLGAPNWVCVTNQPLRMDGKSVLLLDPGCSQRFFRLRLAN